MKKAIVTGAIGQDGSYMCEYLVKLGYEVWGTVRRLPTLVKQTDDYYTMGVKYNYADMRDSISLETLIRKVYPDEIYNFAGQVFVPTSWTNPAETFDINVSGLARILTIVERVCPTARVYQASSSEMFGNTITNKVTSVLDENSPMNPVSPYGVSKYAAHKLVDVYRQKGTYVVSGIAFNHESPRRGSEMVTRKISKHIAALKSGKDVGKLRLGNPDAKKDWGFAGDYVKAMHKMLQQRLPEDYIIGTGVDHSVQEFVECALKTFNVECDVKYNCQEFTRANELHCLVADYSKARKSLGWEPETTFNDLVKMMIDEDCKRYQLMLEEETSHV